MNQIIIKIESGVIADIYFTEPVNITIVDHDVIEGGETFQERMKKAVITMMPDSCVRLEEIEQTVRSLVLECERPRDRQLAKGLSGKAA